MAHELATASDAFLTRLQHDGRISDAARRKAARELGKRARRHDRCSDGARCARWSCELEHGGDR